MLPMRKTIATGVAAGVAVALGGCVFLACDNKYVGAALFSVALLCICYLDYYLFTGKIGYAAQDHSPRNMARLGAGLLANLAATFALGALVRFALPALGEKAAALCAAKLEQRFPETFIRACLCGLLMYLAVQIFKAKKTPVGIFFCIPAFILSGFEHSIADMFYFGASGLLTPGLLRFELAAVLGNAVGSLALALLDQAGADTTKQGERP